jgi:hypothetical protein
MRFIAHSMAFVLLFGAGAFADDIPKADLFFGYSLLRANSAQDLPHFNNDGGLGTFAWNFNNHVALEAEFGGYHNPNIRDLRLDTTEMTYLFGPRFSLGRSKRFDPYIHTLFGGVHLTTSIPVTLAVNPLDTTITGTTTTVGAAQDAFAMALGFGLDIKVSHHFTLRPVQLDYVLTRLQDFGLSGQPSQNRNQSNYRYAGGIMFTFGGERASAALPPEPPPPAPRTKACAGGTTVPFDQECPKQNISLGITANTTQICQGAAVTIAPSGPLPEGAVTQWTINGEPMSKANSIEFGGAGRDPGQYRIGLNVTANGYNDSSAETTVSVLGYTPPTGFVTVSPSEIFVGDKATVSARFSSGQCRGTEGRVTLSAMEGTINGDQFDSSNVPFAPPGSSEQRRTVTIVAKVSDERGSGTAQANVVVKQKAIDAARRLPDVLFAASSDRVNNCGKRVLLEELRTLENNDPAGKVVLVGHTAEGERSPKDLDLKRALNAAAVISAGREVCTAFPASQILVNGSGSTDNGVDFQPNFCGGSTATAERPGQVVAATDDAAKYRRVEVWYVTSGATLPPSASGAKDAAASGVGALGCPR